MAQLVDAADLAVRLGMTFTDAQTAQADAILGLATDLILDAVGKDEAWLDDQADAGTVPARLRVTAMEIGVRGMANPRGTRSTSETIGAHSRSESWADSSAGVALTEREERQCRRAVYGSGLAAPRIGAIVDEPIVRDTYSTGRVLDGVFLDVEDDEDEDDEEAPGS